MDTYIFATDFSENAKHALNFAVPYAKKLNGELLLFHAHDYVDPIVGVPASYAESLNKEKEESVRNQLASWIADVRKMEPDLPCRFIARRLPFEQNILMLAKETQAAAIIMGTKGASGLKKVFMGSNTSSLIGKASCPVYAIPEHSNYTGIKSIVYATDYQEENGDVLEQIGEIANLFDAKIEILYVVTEGSKLNLDIYEWYKQATKEKLYAVDVSFATIKNKSVQAGISEYIKSKEPDLLVMVMHKKNWLQKIIDGSYTRKQVYISQTPILILKAQVYAKI